MAYRRKGVRWLCAAAAPWALGGGLLVSFTASAGQPHFDAAALQSLWQSQMQASALIEPSWFIPQQSVPANSFLTQDLFSTLNVSQFQPYALALEDQHTTTQQASAAIPPLEKTPVTLSGDISPVLTPSQSDGGTPAAPRAVALSSTTPAPAEATPIASLAMPVSLTFNAPTALPPEPPRQVRSHYANVIDPEQMKREQRCLAEAIYFEARSESDEGQAAVAQVVLNRVKSGLYPSSVCGVVYQNRHRHLACQFTFACEGKRLRVTDRESWHNATRIAREVIEGSTYVADIGASTHYHAHYVRPYWARRLKKMDVIGRHIFYKLRPGQT
jgi:spore germination cell wall hydrolase CwlJ-like protein